MNSGTSKIEIKHLTAEQGKDGSQFKDKETGTVGGVMCDVADVQSAGGCLVAHTYVCMLVTAAGTSACSKFVNGGRINPLGSLVGQVGPGSVFTHPCQTDTKNCD